MRAVDAPILLSFLLLGSCVDDRLDGLSEQLLLARSSVASPLARGEEATLVFQALSDSGDGLTDQKIEVSISDVSRIRFVDAEGSRAIYKTKESVNTDGVIVVGAATVGLVVPPSAQPGTVLVIASLGGDKTTFPKTRWAEIEIQVSGGEGEGGAPNEGGNAGASGGKP